MFFLCNLWESSVSSVVKINTIPQSSQRILKDFKENLTPESAGFEKIKQISLTWNWAKHRIDQKKKWQYKALTNTSAMGIPSGDTCPFQPAGPKQGSE